MTREQAKELLPIIQAYAEGKTIEYSYDGEHWERNDAPVWDCDVMFRIKPQPKYRPFKTQKECWNEMLKHQPFGWIYSKNESCYYCIISVDEDKIELSPDMYPHSETTPKEYYLEKDYFFFDAALESFEFAFADGTPFGIKKEE